MLNVCLRNDTWWILIFLEVDSNAAPDSSEACILAEISSSKGKRKNSVAVARGELLNVCLASDS